MQDREFWDVFYQKNDERLATLISAERDKLPVYLDFIADKELFKKGAQAGFLTREDGGLLALSPHAHGELKFALLDYYPKIPESVRSSGADLSDFPAMAQSIGLNVTRFDTTENKWHRCPVEGKNHRNKDGAYIISNRGAYYSIYASNMSTQQSLFFSTYDRVKHVPKSTNNALMANAKMNAQARDSALLQLAKERSVDAKKLWESLPRATGQEPYAKNKQLQSTRLIKHLSNGELVVPLFNQDREIMTLQVITPDRKTLMLDGRKKGSFAVVGDLARDPERIIVGEGLATVDSALAVYKSIYPNDRVMGFACVDCHNMQEVAPMLAQRYPNAELLIAADNDCEKSQNAGLMAAENVKEQVSNARILLPDMQGKACDWNDLFVANKSAAKAQMQEQCPAIERQAQATQTQQKSEHTR